MLSCLRCVCVCVCTLCLSFSHGYTERLRFCNVTWQSRLRGTITVDGVEKTEGVGRGRKWGSTLTLRKRGRGDTHYRSPFSCTSGFVGFIPQRLACMCTPTCLSRVLWLMRNGQSLKSFDVCESFRITTSWLSWCCCSLQPYPDISYDIHRLVESSFMGCDNIHVNSECGGLHCFKYGYMFYPAAQNQNQPSWKNRAGNMKHYCFHGLNKHRIYTLVHSGWWVRTS